MPEDNLSWHISGGRPCFETGPLTGLALANLARLTVGNPPASASSELRLHDSPTSQSLRLLDKHVTC